MLCQICKRDKAEVKDGDLHLCHWCASVRVQSEDESEYRRFIERAREGRAA